MNNLKKYLTKSSVAFVLFTSFATFLTYLFFYPFRRAYTAATYSSLIFWGINYKILIITAQVFGFVVSKGLGIKYVSEMLPQHRIRNLILIITTSLLAYLGFGLVPAPANLLFIFIANIPLGLLYGTVLGFLEGRKTTELLVAVLTASFIVGSGFAKTIGSWVMNGLGVSELMMPFVACLIMYVPLLLSIGLMSLIPLPNRQDTELRTTRKPMGKAERKAFIRTFSLGILLFTLSYFLLTTFREFRDNFTPEILKKIGYTNNSAIFTQTEVPIAVSVLLIMMAIRWIKDNYRAFVVIQYLAFLGGGLIALSTLLFQHHLISPIVWLTLLGFGVYLAFALSNSLYFERMLAAFKWSGTVSFLITMADFYAYFGSILVLLYKNFFQKNIDFLSFFIVLSYAVSILYLILISSAMIYFRKKRTTGGDSLF